MFARSLGIQALNQTYFVGTQKNYPHFIPYLVQQKVREKVLPSQEPADLTMLSST